MVISDLSHLRDDFETSNIAGSFSWVRQTNVAIVSAKSKARSTAYALNGDATAISKAEATVIVIQDNN